MQMPCISKDCSNLWAGQFCWCCNHSNNFFAGTVSSLNLTGLVLDVLLHLMCLFQCRWFCFYRRWAEATTAWGRWIYSMRFMVALPQELHIQQQPPSILLGLLHLLVKNSMWQNFLVIMGWLLELIQQKLDHSIDWYLIPYSKILSWRY